MPRFFFHVQNDSPFEDEAGVDLADADAAREHALERARELVCADMSQGWLNLNHRIEIVSESGTSLMTITFREAFEVRS